MPTKREIAGLICLWVIVTAANLCKPYHIDDAAHLIIAQWILRHPLHPMRGLLNWSGTAQPIYETNQPHLYFYALAGWGKLFGFGEVAMHALQALFAAACIGLFYRLARRLAGQDAPWLTAMLALNPAFIVGQNLMVDVPLLACWLGFFEALLGRRHGVAMGFCAAAILIKYTSLLLPIMFLAAVAYDRRWRQAWWLCLPLTVLLLWSAFNFYDYGGVHLTTAFHASAKTYVPRAHRHFELGKRLVKSLIAWIVAVGALTPFGIIAAGQAWPRRAAWLYVTCFCGLAALAAAVWAGWLPDRWADRLLWLGFAASGVAVLVQINKSFLLLFFKKEALVLLFWITLTSLFYILFAPFIAARHVLLILPAISLLAAMQGALPRPAKVFGLAMTVLISAGLCVSDVRFAVFYRDEAAAIPRAFPPGTTLWAAGHWGWQYYAMQDGFLELDVQHSVMRAGDILAVPREVDHQLPAGLELAPLRSIRGNFSHGDPFCTGRPSRFYLSYTFRGPWSLSADCTQHINLFEVLRHAG